MDEVEVPKYKRYQHKVIDSTTAGLNKLALTTMELHKIKEIIPYLLNTEASFNKAKIGAVP
eukprot:9447241-Ditylum_brightwellii.AAC.1